MAKNLELSLKIKALVDGVNHIKGLANEVKGLAEKANTPMSDPTTPVRDGARETSLALRDLASGLAGIFSLAAVKQFVTSSVQQFSQAESAFRGLESVADFTGVGIGRAMQEAGKLAADGLITTQEASKALQNLLSRGYDIDEAVQTLTRLKDSAAFNRQAHLSLGEAVVSASEGLKNENSILVDNAGVTKNVSILWKEYAAEIGKTVGRLTQQEKIQAEVNGILRETEAQAGNASRAAQGMQGQLATLDATTNQFKASLGEALVPAVITLTRSGILLINEFLKPMLFLAKAGGIAAGEFAGSLGALFDLIKTRDLAAFRQRRKELSALADQLRREAAASLADGQLNITAAPDSGKRRTSGTPEPAVPATDRNSRTSAQLRTEFNTSFVLLKDALARERAQLDASLEQRLISRRDYWANVNRLNQAGFDAERERLLKERAELIANQRRLNGDTDALLANKQRIEKIGTDLIILARERLSVAGEAARSQAKAEQELEQALDNVRRRMSELTGAADDNDRRAAIANGFRDLLAQVAGDVEATALIERLIDVEAADANLRELERRWSLALNNLRNAQQSVHIQQQQRLITTAQAQQLITAAQQQTAAELQQLLPLMEQTAITIGPDAVARVQAWKNELAQVQHVVDPIASSINTSVKNAFTDMFVSISNGTKSAKTAFLDFARSVLNAINRIAAQRLAESLFGNLLGGIGGSGGSGGSDGIGGFISRLFKGFADGGLVTGPGSGTSDSIPARLSAGEYVLNAAAVRRVGVDFLHRLNGASSPPRLLGGRLGYADGGLAGDLSLSPAAAPTVNQSVRIVNSVDPRITKDFLTSSEGEKVILNIISRNNAALKQALS